MMKLIIPTDALELLEYVEDNPGLIFGEDFDWDESFPEEGIFYDLNEFLDFIEWKGRSGEYLRADMIDEGGNHASTPTIRVEKEHVYFKMWENGEIVIRRDSLKKIDNTVKFFWAKESSSDPNIKIMIETDIRDLAIAKYRGRKRLEYAPFISLFHFLTHVNRDLFIINKRTDGGCSGLFDDLQRQILKYKINDESEWKKFITEKVEGGESLPLRTVAWRDSEEDFGVWIKPSQIVSDTRALLPPGQALYIKGSSLNLKDFQWYNLNGTYSMLFYLPNLHFCYVFAQYGFLSTQGADRKPRNLRYEERICYSPKKEFPLPTPKPNGKGKPPFHHWRGEDPKFAIDQVTWHQILTPQVEKELGEEEKEIVRKFREIIDLLRI